LKIAFGDLRRQGDRLRRSCPIATLTLLLSACSGQTQLPKGPPPEYEDDPIVTQDAAPAAPVVDAGVE